ncbi:AraC family transcriptional regulator [Luteolibacter sp. Populi]|uniref:AraC family transcriptional regulator n=1 Tax=Luteolibacter sp. Populi TaxID=3230487 RepID=UPI003467DB0B
MKHRREHIQIPEGSSFRLIEWRRGLDEVDVILDEGQRRTVRGEGTRWHFHPEMELTWFSRGEGLRFVGDSIAPFAAGDLVLVGRRLPHHWEIRGNSAGLSIQWHYPDAHPLWSIPEMRAVAGLFARAGQGLTFTPRIAADTAARMREMARTPKGAARFSILLGIFSSLASAVDETVALSREAFVPPPENSLHYAGIRDAVSHILKSFREPIPMERMLAITGLSRPTFCRQFRIHTGHSFSEFVNRVRLHAACRELRKTGKSVIDVALESGISQVSFFNRLFLREMGCTPSVYRKTQAGKRE